MENWKWKTEANKNNSLLTLSYHTSTETYEGVNHDLLLSKGMNHGIDVVISGETQQIGLREILCHNAVDLEKEVNKP